MPPLIDRLVTTLYLIKYLRIYRDVVVDIICHTPFKTNSKSEFASKFKYFSHVSGAIPLWRSGEKSYRRHNYLAVSRPTQPSIPPESVNEYQLRLGRQRQVWFIPIADERGVCR